MKFLLLLLLFCNSLLANQTIIELSEEEKEYLKEPLANSNRASS